MNCRLLDVNQPNAILDVEHLNFDAGTICLPGPMTLRQPDIPENLDGLFAIFMFYEVIGHSRWATHWN